MVRNGLSLHLALVGRVERERPARQGRNERPADTRATVCTRVIARIIAWIKRAMRLLRLPKPERPKNERAMIWIKKTYPFSGKGWGEDHLPIYNFASRPMAPMPTAEC